LPSSAAEARLIWQAKASAVRRTIAALTNVVLVLIGHLLIVCKPILSFKVRIWKVRASYDFRRRPVNRARKTFHTMTKLDVIDLRPIQFGGQPGSRFDLTFMEKAYGRVVTTACPPRWEKTA